MKVMMFFFSGRLISYNSLVAFEILHSIKRILKGKKARAAIKVDKMKAYDRVKLSFFQFILLK